MKPNEMPPDVQRAYKMFPERLYRARRAKNMTQMEAELQTGINKTTISMYENGMRQPVFGNLVMLASVYEVSVGWLLGEV